MTGTDEAGDALRGVEIPYSQFVLGVERDEPVGGEVERAKGCAPWRLDNLVDSALAEDEDFARAELGFVGGDCEERLYRFIG